MRASIRRESQQRRMREKAHQRGLNTNYLEGEYDDDDDDENTISLAAIKTNYKAQKKGLCFLIVQCMKLTTTLLKARIKFKENRFTLV